MDGDRKYKQRGYQDSEREASGSFRQDRPKPQGPKLPLDVTGPKLPRLVQSVAAARCFNCSTMLPAGTDFQGTCPKCNASLHCCKQCAHFEPSTRFQCLKPIPERIAVKDKPNECTFFAVRVTVARDGQTASAPSFRPIDAGRPPAAPKTPSDARAAFDSLFKK